MFVLCKRACAGGCGSAQVRIGLGKETEQGQTFEYELLVMVTCKGSSPFIVQFLIWV